VYKRAHSRSMLFCALAFGLLLDAPAAFGQAAPIRPQAVTPSTRAVGSWFGRAIPSDTVCTKAQDPTCPVPNEIIMVFTIHDDRTFIGIDSNIFSGGTHTTAHGQWGLDGPSGITARFTLLQSSPTGVFLGGFTNVFKGTMTGDDSMEGTIDARLYLYTNADGSAIVGSDGLPTPSPLDAPTCAPPSCQHLGVFSFKAKRVKAQ
jgi:hypothetical protein